ncbi:uncharacterized protein [Argopecten irradians]|uniref:uncharacterized protein n=1 Tax=Argopecten irradians TaxID=31199 RepID=UPI0037101ADE
MITFGRVGGAIQTNAHLITSNSKPGVPNTFKCANECIGLGCLAFRYWKEEAMCITYFIQGTGQTSSDLVTKYFAKSEIWTISVYIGTDPHAGSKHNLFVDIQGTLSAVSNFLLGPLKKDEIRRDIYLTNFGEISHIRLHSTGMDGLQIWKATLEDVDGRLYTFLCNCWIDNGGDVGPGVQSSYLLYPQSE